MNYFMLGAGILYWAGAFQYFTTGNWKLGVVSVLYGVVNFVLASIR